MFGSSNDNFVAFIVDNMNANRHFPKQIEPMFGSCHIHWIDWSVEDVIKDNKVIINKVHAIMRKLLYFMTAAIQRRVFHLNAKLSNGSRWSSRH